MIPLVDLKHCSFDSTKGRLTLPSEYVGMPRKLRIRSHHTGRTLLFQSIGVDHPLFDSDGWDGEQQIYEPVEPVKNTKYLVIYHQY